MTRALVTGGSGDIGAAICQVLAGAGMHVIVHTNRNTAKAAQVVEQIRAGGGSAETIQFDIADFDQVTRHMQALVQSEPIQVLVNNAGVHDDAIMAGMRPEQWHSVVDINLNGFFHVTQPLLLPMMQTRWGRIINIVSISALAGNRGQANYAAAKAGVVGATKSLAKEVASRGITVNAIAPGIIQSDMTKEVFDKQTIKQLVPMQCAGEPQDIAGLVAFLVSGAARYITGEVINVNGGMY